MADFLKHARRNGFQVEDMRPLGEEDPQLMDEQQANGRAVQVPMMQQENPNADDGYIAQLTKGFGSGALGVGTGIGKVGQLALNTDGSVLNGLDQYAQQTLGRGKEWSVQDMWDDPIGYLTDPSGLTYGVGNLGGSMAALTALGYAAGAAIPSSATLGIAGMLARVATKIGSIPGLSNVGFKSAADASKFFFEPGTQQLTKQGAFVVNSYIGNLLESLSEGGSAGGEKLAETGDINEARKTMAIDAALNAAILGTTGTLGSANLSKMIDADGKHKIATWLTGGALNMLEEPFEEGTQEMASQASQGKARYSDILQPWNWTPEAQQQAVEAGIVSPILGGLQTAGGRILSRIAPQQQAEQEQQETPKDKPWMSFLENYKAQDEETQKAIDNALGYRTTPEEAELLARRLGWKGEQVQPKEETVENGNLRATPIQDGIEDADLGSTNPYLKRGVDALNTWAYENFGRDLLITGGARSEANNASVNGSPTSHHLRGNAVDIDISHFDEEERNAILAKAKEMGFNDDGENMYHDVGNGLHMHLIPPSNGKYNKADYKMGGYSFSGLESQNEGIGNYAQELQQMLDANNKEIEKIMALGDNATEEDLIDYQNLSNENKQIENRLKANNEYLGENEKEQGARLYNDDLSDIDEIYARSFYHNRNAKNSHQKIVANNSKISQAKAEITKIQAEKQTKKTAKAIEEQQKIIADLSKENESLLQTLAQHGNVGRKVGAKIRNNWYENQEAPTQEQLNRDARVLSNATNLELGRYADLVRDRDNADPRKQLVVQEMQKRGIDIGAMGQTVKEQPTTQTEQPMAQNNEDSGAIFYDSAKKPSYDIMGKVAASRQRFNRNNRQYNPVDMQSQEDGTVDQGWVDAQVADSYNRATGKPINKGKLDRDKGVQNLLRRAMRGDHDAQKAFAGMPADIKKYLLDKAQGKVQAEADRLAAENEQANRDMPTNDKPTTKPTPAPKPTPKPQPAPAPQPKEPKPAPAPAPQPAPAQKPEPTTQPTQPEPTSQPKPEPKPKPPVEKPVDKPTTKPTEETQNDNEFGNEDDAADDFGDTLGIEPVKEPTVEKPTEVTNNEDAEFGNEDDAADEFGDTLGIKPEPKPKEPQKPTKPTTKPANKPTVDKPAKEPNNSQSEDDRQWNEDVDNVIAVLDTLNFKFGLPSVGKPIKFMLGKVRPEFKKELFNVALLLGNNAYNKRTKEFPKWADEVYNAIYTKKPEAAEKIKPFLGAVYRSVEAFDKTHKGQRPDANQMKQLVSGFVYVGERFNKGETTLDAIVDGFMKKKGYAESNREIIKNAFEPAFAGIEEYKVKQSLVYGEEEKEEPTIIIQTTQEEMEAERRRKAEEAANNSATQIALRALVKLFKLAGINVVQNRQKLIEELQSRGYSVIGGEGVERDTKALIVSDGRGTIELFGCMIPSTGTMLLDPNTNLDTPIHEYVHLWNAVVKKTNPNLWKRGVALAKQSDLWAQMYSDQSYQQQFEPRPFEIAQYMRENPKVTEAQAYNAVKDSNVADEVWARICGPYGENELLAMAGRAENSDSLIERMKSWVKEFWSTIKNAFKNWGVDIVDDMEIEDFRKMPFKALSEGIKLNDILNDPTYDNTDNGITRQEAEKQAKENRTRREEHEEAEIAREKGVAKKYAFQDIGWDKIDDEIYSGDYAAELGKSNADWQKELKEALKSTKHSVKGKRSVIPQFVQKMIELGATKYSIEMVISIGNENAKKELYNNWVKEMNKVVDGNEALKQVFDFWLNPIYKVSSAMNTSIIGRPDGWKSSKAMAMAVEKAGYLFNKGEKITRREMADDCKDALGDKYEEFIDNLYIKPAYDAIIELNQPTEIGKVEDEDVTDNADNGAGPNVRGRDTEDENGRPDSEGDRRYPEGDRGNSEIEEEEDTTRGGDGIPDSGTVGGGEDVAAQGEDEESESGGDTTRGDNDISGDNPSFNGEPDANETDVENAIDSATEGRTDGATEQTEVKPKTEEEKIYEALPKEEQKIWDKVVKQMPFLSTLQKGNITAWIKRIWEGKKETHINEQGEEETTYKKEQAIVLTDGTGTGKTYSGLAMAKDAFDNRGAKRVLVVTPSVDICEQWIAAAKNNEKYEDGPYEGQYKGFNIPNAKFLANKRDGGSDFVYEKDDQEVKDGKAKIGEKKKDQRGIYLTTFANWEGNNEILTQNWDLVLVDEAHNLMESEDGDMTGYLEKLRALTYHPAGMTDRAEIMYGTPEERKALEQYQKIRDSYRSKFNKFKRFASRHNQFSMTYPDVSEWVKTLLYVEEAGEVMPQADYISTEYSTDENGNEITHKKIEVLGFNTWLKNNKNLSKEQYDKLEKKYDALYAETKGITVNNDHLKDLEDDVNYKNSPMMNQIEEARKKWEKIAAVTNPIKQRHIQEWMKIPKEKKTKVAFLSATPFCYAPDIELAEGYVFDYDPVPVNLKMEYPALTPRQWYLVTYFGWRIEAKKQKGEFRMRRPPANEDNSANEVAFHEYLREIGALRGESLSIEADYNRGFLVVQNKNDKDSEAAGIGKFIDKGYEALNETKIEANKVVEQYAELKEFLYKGFNAGDKRKLLEAIKAEAAVKLAKEYLSQGKKVAIIFRNVATKQINSPFDFPKEWKGPQFTGLQLDKKDELIQKIRGQYRQFLAEHPEFTPITIVDQLPKANKTLASSDVGNEFRYYAVKNSNGKYDLYKLAFDKPKNGKQGKFYWESFGETDLKDNVNTMFANIKTSLATLQKPESEGGFKKGQALYYYGNVSDALKEKVLKQFNDDNSGQDVFIGQVDACQEGLNLHDKFGAAKGGKQRVLINITIPQKPSEFTQIEGRIYRFGTNSNAIYRYLTTGTQMETELWTGVVAGKVATSENLAMGSRARGLMNSIRDAFIETMFPEVWRQRLPGKPNEDVGGKEIDYRTNNGDPYDNAIFDYKNSEKFSRVGGGIQATPEPIGLKMVEWAKANPGQKMLEPSAGYGSISRYFPIHQLSTIIEPNPKVAAIAKLYSPSSGYVQGFFDNFSTTAKFDSIVMTPPRTDINNDKEIVDADHIIKSMFHLKDGGRIVALVENKKDVIDKIENFINGKIDGEEFDTLKNNPWFKPEESKFFYVTSRIQLPKAVWGRSGSKAGGVVLIIDRHRSPQRLQNVHTNPNDYLGLGAYDENLTVFNENMTTEELFEKLRNGYDNLIPERLPVDNKTAKETAKVLKWFNEEFMPFRDEIRQSWMSRDLQKQIEHLPEIIDAILEFSPTVTAYEKGKTDVVGLGLWSANRYLSEGVGTGGYNDKGKRAFYIRDAEKLDEFGFAEVRYKLLVGLKKYFRNAYMNYADAHKEQAILVDWNDKIKSKQDKIREDTNNTLCGWDELAYVTTKKGAYIVNPLFKLKNKEELQRFIDMCEGEAYNGQYSETKGFIFDSFSVAKRFATRLSGSIDSQISRERRDKVQKGHDELIEKEFDSLPKFSATTQADTRSKKEILSEIKKAFPNGKFEQDEDGNTTVTLPNGAKFQYSIEDQIIVNAKELDSVKKAHGKSAAVIEGYWKKLTKDGVDRLLAISQNSRIGTTYHESLHAAMDLALTHKEKQALFKHYEKNNNGKDVEEAIADSYREWKLAREKQKGSLFGKLWQKVTDVLKRVKAFFGGDKTEKIFQDIESGSVYERGAAGNDLNETKYQAAGRKGASAFGYTEARIKAIEERIDSGEDGRKIFKETGWYKGRDGKMRFEIPDIKENIHLERLNVGEKKKLSEIYDNSLLFKAYPWLRDVTVTGENEAGAYWDNKNKVLGIGVNMTQADFNAFKNTPGMLDPRITTAKDFMLSTVIHEVQHIIQDHEGFAEGDDGSASRRWLISKITKQMDALKEKYPEIQQYWQTRRDLEFQENRLANGKLTSEQRKQIETWKQKFEEDANKLSKRIPEKAIREFEMAMEHRQDIVSMRSDSAFEELQQVYQNVAGEQEARSAQVKMFLNPNSDEYWDEINKVATNKDAVLIYGGKGANLSANVGKNNARYSARPSEQNDAVSVTDLKRVAEKILPIKASKVYRETQDSYDGHAKVGLIHNNGDVTTLAGIVGMHLDKEFKICRLKFNGHASNEATQEILDKSLENARASMGAAEFARYEKLNNVAKIKRGVAAFMRRFIRNPQKAQEEYPIYYGEFTNALAKDKTLQNKVDAFIKTCNDYEGLTPEGKARASVSKPQAEEPHTMVEKIKDIWHKKVYPQFIDDKDPLHRFVLKAQEKIGKAIEKIDDPYVQARIASSSAANKVNMFVMGPAKGKTDEETKEIRKAVWQELSRGNQVKLYHRDDKGEIVIGRKDKNGKVIEDKEHGIAVTDTLDLADATIARERNGETVKERLFSKDPIFYSDVIDELAPLEEKTKTDKGLQNYLNNHGFKNWEQALGTYLLANRFLEIWKTKPKYTGSMTREQAKRMVKYVPKEIKNAANAYYEFDKNILGYMLANGMISEESYIQLTKYEAYCPLFRDFADEQAFDKYISHMSNMNSSINLSNGIKYLTEGGSDRTVLDDPVVSMMRMTAAIIGKCENNKTAQKFVALSKHSGIGEFVMPEYDKEGKQLETPNPQESVFTVYEDGKKKAYRTTPELYEVLNGNNEQANEMWTVLENLAGLSSNILRKGATISPDFVVRNILKDNLSAWINSKNNYIPGVDWVKGWNALGDEGFKARFDASGASMASYFRQDQKGLMATVEDMAGRTEHWYDYNWFTKNLAKMVASAWERWEKIGERAENATRAGEYLKALKNGKSDIEAAYDAKEATLDFSRHGKFGKHINRTNTFWNAVVQGGDKAVRTVRDNPSRAMTTLGSMMLAAMCYWAIYHDDDWWKELENEDKYSGVHIPFKDDGIQKHITIPLPQEYGVAFWGGTVAALENLMNENPKAVKEWIKQFVWQATPSFIPTLFRPLMEIVANYDFYFASSVEGKKYQSLSSEARYNNKTSEVSKFIGSTQIARAVGLSPIKTEHLIRGYTGGAGIFLARLVPNDNKEPAKYWSEYPFIGNFVRTDYEHSKSVTDWYDLKEKLDQYHATYERGQKPAYMTGANKISTEIAKTRRKINALRDADIAPERKRQLMRNLNLRVVELARLGVKTYSKYEH